MTWFKKNKGKESGKSGSNTSAAKTPSPPADKSAAIRAEALANMRGARERIGEENIQKIAAALQKKQNSPLEQAKAKIEKLTDDDATRVAEEILSMLETRH